MSSVDDYPATGEQLARVYKSLAGYSQAHPLSEIGVFRRPYGGVSIRIVDPDLSGLSTKEREDRIWPLLEVHGDALLNRISVLLLQTPDEAARAQISTVEFANPESQGPVPFLKKEACVFRRFLDGHTVFVTVGRPILPNLELSDSFDAAIKLDVPPGMTMADDDCLSIDVGEILRDEHHAIRWFASIDEARDATFEAARHRLARLAAA